jgi:tetratricopeptide (TPR) repeat protein
MPIVIRCWIWPCFLVAIVAAPSGAAHAGDDSGDHRDRDRDRALLRSALEEISHFNFDGAYASFIQVQRNTLVGSDEWQEATFGAATCAQQTLPPSQAKAQEARELYQLLLEKSPQSKYAPRTMMNLGRLAELRDYFGDAVDPSRARQWYQQVVERWPDDPIAGEATLRIAATYIQTYDIEQVRVGIALLESWLVKHPRDPLAGGMWSYLADMNFLPMQNYARSIECYRQADRFRFADRNRQGQVYWRAAVNADRYLNDRDTAVHFYTKLIADVPNSGMGYAAQVALKRLGAAVPEIQLYSPKRQPPAQANAGATP